ncbi:TerD family protein [Psychrobacter sp. F1192]|uniref:TerD family protein n=1 Tax=Psychrobacter coccoides TaxID=2818440 RepID=A0ABS3NKT4_9GAMM|nr:TerD family protein [Psychrobacter coccoides]MBO1529693.1 TerD family protein [Psychrobacter coccoides]
MSTSSPLSSDAAPILSDSLKALGITTDTLLFGLNYAFTKTEPKGMLKRFKKNQSAIDIDLACVLYDDNCNISDMVWFKQLRDKTESIRHQGDSLNGKDRGEQALYEGPLDQEQIRLYLSKIPAHINQIGLLVSSYHGEPLSKVKAGEVHLSDDEGNRAFMVNLKQLPHDCHCIWAASLQREVDDWHMTLQNLPLAASDLQNAAQEVAHELARALPVPLAVRT